MEQHLWHDGQDRGQPTNNAVYLIRGTVATERSTLTGGDETAIDGGVGTALAVDPVSGNLFVDHGSDVTIYDSLRYDAHQLHADQSSRRASPSARARATSMSPTRPPTT